MAPADDDSDGDQSSISDAEELEDHGGRTAQSAVKAETETWYIRPARQGMPSTAWSSLLQAMSPKQVGSEMPPASLASDDQNNFGETACVD